MGERGEEKEQRKGENWKKMSRGGMEKIEEKEDGRGIESRKEDGEKDRGWIEGKGMEEEGNGSERYKLEPGRAVLN